MQKVLSNMTGQKLIIATCFLGEHACKLYRMACSLNRELNRKKFFALMMMATRLFLDRAWATHLIFFRPPFI
jgi:hypothetical protein